MSDKDVVTDEYSLLFGDCLERIKENIEEYLI